MFRIRTVVLAVVCWLASVFPSPLQAQSNLLIRVMSANLTSGTQQSYESPGIRIFQGLRPDVVAIQEFQYGNSSLSNDLRTLVNTAFGSGFHFYCEPNGNIPNGIVSRWPIIAAGWWDDPLVSDRNFAWAQMDLPGTNELYVVSVHLYGSGSAGDRATEASVIKSNIVKYFPANAWVIVGGDMNTSSRTEAAINTFTTFLSDHPIPTDAVSAGDEDTNEPRNNPYDYVLPSFSLTNHLTPVVMASHTFPKGLVFDSAVYTPLSDVSPVQAGDSHVSGMQHMAVVKDFLIPLGNPDTSAPTITAQPQDINVASGSNATFSVSVSGAAPFSYQWRFFGTNLPGATAGDFTRSNVQPSHVGGYSVVITNNFGSVTSAVAQLTIVTAPMITTQPQNLSVNVGENATFSVSATGEAPLNYQWRFGDTNLQGATASSFTRTNAQLADAGSYAVVITNSSGSVTSSVASLAVFAGGAGDVIAQWNFNSVSPDANTGTGATNPSIGAGGASLVGGTTATFAGGDASLDPAGSTDNSGWNTATYPAVSSNNKTAGARFNVSTAGKQHIVITWSSQSSSTGSKYGRMQFTTNGTDFVDFVTAFTNGTSFTRKTNNLAAMQGVNDNPSFAIRFMSEFESTATGGGTAGYIAANAGSTYGTAGTMRYDMVTVAGSSLASSNAPALPPTLTNLLVTANAVQFLLTGSAGSNYTVQASTNLGASHWLSLRTNAAPFTFADSNITGFQHRFYRGLVAP